MDILIVVLLVAAILLFLAAAFSSRAPSWSSNVGLACVAGAMLLASGLV